MFSIFQKNIYLIIAIIAVFLVISCVKNSERVNATKQMTIEVLKKIDMLILQAQTYQSMGQYVNSLNQFNSAMLLLDKSKDKALQAIVMQGLGQIHQFMGNVDKAMECLETAFKIADENKDTALQASLLNDLGNVLFLKPDYAKAVEKYLKSIELAKQRKEKEKRILVKSSINAAKVYYELKKYKEGQNFIDSALKDIKHLEDSREKIYDQIALAKISSRLHQTDNSMNQNFLNQIYDLLDNSLNIAKKIKDPLAASYALGILGELYEKQKHYDEALSFYRQAIFEAQKCQANESLMQWQWQTGRLLKVKGDLDGALMAYQQAITSLEAVRSDLFVDCKGKRLSFRDTVGPLYFETADCLLLRSGSIQDIALKQKDLHLARSVIEKLKTSELQDYFQDECITYLQSKIISIEEISPRTAALYPIILPERIELLLCLKGVLKQVTIPVKSEDFIAIVRVFRRAVEKPVGPSYKAYGQRLYKMLIQPFEADLKGNQIDTLILKATGLLRVKNLEKLPCRIKTARSPMKNYTPLGIS